MRDASSAFLIRFRSGPCSVLGPAGGSGLLGGSTATSGYLQSFPDFIQVSHGVCPPSLSHLILDFLQRRQAMLDRRGCFLTAFLSSAPPMVAVRLAAPGSSWPTGGAVPGYPPRTPAAVTG